MDALLGNGVKISPSIVEFFDVEPQVVHQMHISVQNLSKTSKVIRFLPPITDKFRVHCKEVEKTIAPGLHLNALVEYYNDVEEDCEDHVVFMIGDNFVEVPLISYAPKPILTISGSVDFGTIVADGQVFTKEIAILNHGTKCGDFKIIPNTALPFHFLPAEGTVNPGYSQPIRFEFTSNKVGNITDKLKCELEGQKSNFIHIKTNVVSRSLHLLTKDDSAKQVECINFGSTYYGTDVIQSYLLYNSSPYETNFLAIMEEGGEGEELSVDVTKTVGNGYLEKHTEKSQVDPSSIVSIIPHEGVLSPFEKRLVYFKFSPRFIKPTKGWKHGEKPLPREDYAIFMQIQSAMGVCKDDCEGLKIELAMTGTALPVVLTILPSPIVKFDECPVGGTEESVIELRNDSVDLPICYAVRKVAHFHLFPVCGFIEANQIKELLVTFQPKQIGEFNCNLVLDIIGQVCDMDESVQPVFKKAVMESRLLEMSGKALSCRQIKHSSKKYFSKSKSAIDIINTDRSFLNLNSANNTKSGRCKTSESVKIAHPDDRASSIRPSDRKEMFRTKFTKLNRYTYVDPDYSYTDKEQAERIAHQRKYGKLLSRDGEVRKQKKMAKEFAKVNNDIDLGIKPGQGLKPPKVTVKEIIDDQSKTMSKDDANQTEKQLLTSKVLDNQLQSAMLKKIAEGLKAFPCTSLEKEACQALLSPQELFQIIFEPTLIDFGDVCRKSVCCRELKIINNINKTIGMQLDINCRELRQTSPISQVIPPETVAKVEFIFESAKLGKFERNVNYVVNGKHKSHLLVHANIVTVGLELSTQDIVLYPTHGMSAESGLRKCVTLINRRNMAAEFTWSPVVKQGGTSFTIRPAKGVAEPFSTLECEVVFYPSYSANYFGEFIATIENGNELSLRCSAQIGPTSCSFVERRLMFGALPLNLTTTRSAFLRNTSNNHAYFKVVVEHPLQGMVIRPKEGVVPVGGITELQVSYKPELIHKFDTQVEIDILGWKTISLRMGGHVEVPSVDVDIDSFNFGGTFCGAKTTIPFKLKNLGRSNAQIMFDLSFYKDFKVTFVGQEMYENIYQDKGYYNIYISGQDTVEALLQFSPTEVASYDFVLPVNVNHQHVPSPPPSPYPASVETRTYVVSSNSSQIPSNEMHFPTASRRVQATGLRAPLQLSAKILDFVLPASYFDLNINHHAGRVKSILIVNNSIEKLCWNLEIDSCSDLFDEGIFSFLFKNTSSSIQNVKQNSQLVVLEGGEAFELHISFNPVEAKMYSASVPVILNENKSNPYCFIQLRGELMTPSLLFSPSSISFNSLPLLTEAVADVKIIGKNFNSDTPIDVFVPQIELEDGSSVDVLEVKFHGDPIMRKSSLDLSNQRSSSFTCTVKFYSKVQVSFSTNIIFTCENLRYELPVQGCTDNCLLTCFNFLSNSQNDFHIVCERMKQKKAENDLSSSEESVFIPCVSPIRVPTCVSMITSSTPFSLHSTSCDDSSMVSTSDSSSGRRSDAPHTVEVDEFSPYEYVIDNIPESDTDEWKTLKDVMKTIQRWYSSQCWSNGYYPIVLPYSLRNCFTTVSVGSNSTSRACSWNRDGKKQSKNIIDIIAHLCGKPVPGLSTNISLSTSTDDRLDSILTLYSSLLAFLRCQGAMVSAIKPEYLLDHHDYHYHMIREKGKDTLEEDRYEFLSRKAWTELLLQVIKVLVLARITPHTLKKMLLPNKYPPMPTFNPDPCCSNVYSVSERIILAWINHHFEQQRSRNWKDLFGVEAPASRWIVNFENDFVDGLVLASLLAAYTPYVGKSHLHSLYTHTNTAEQCLHNNLKVVDAFRFIGLDFDVLATDITEPNAVGMLLLCIYLYENLPKYLPKSTIEMTGSFHAVVSKHIKLQNPSNKPLVYEAVIAGENFSLPGGCHIQIPPKGNMQLLVEYKSRSLKPCNATLILVVKRIGSAIGSTLVFNLRGSIDTIIPSGIIKCVSPCYELKKLKFDVKNPFSESAFFQIILAETNKADEMPLLTKAKGKKNVKKTASRTDHGQHKELSSPKKHPGDVINDLKVWKKEQVFTSFWAPKSSLQIDALSTNEVEVHFLPFHVGSLQCSILFLNEEIGEFIYSIEAESCLPLPSMVPFHRDGSGIRVTSATAVLHSQGLLKDDNRIIYLHCEAQKTNQEELHIVVNNTAKEKALVLAAKQRMSEKELHRREVTGITSSNTIISAMSSLVLNDSVTRHHPFELLDISGETKEFSIELTSPYFKAPKKISVTIPNQDIKEVTTVTLPISVLPCPPGQYPCSVILKAPNDIRVYHIECTIKHSDVCIQLDFNSPTHQRVLQDVPVINHSDIGWNLEAEISGEGFSGPETFVATSDRTSNYPLSFKPIYEGIVEGSLVLRNTSNGAENKFDLIGRGTKPLSLDNIEIDCIVNETTMRVVEVTNNLNHKVVFQTFSDLNMLSGPPFVTVLPKRTVQVPITVTTKKRGLIEGCIMFIHDAEFTARLGLDRTLDYDSDEDETEATLTTPETSNYLTCKSSQFADLSQSDKFQRPYRLWYSININSIPAKPEKRMEICSPMHETSTMELHLKNPLEIDLEMEVIINGNDLYGEPTICIPPLQSIVYQLYYEPTTIGKSKACVIFQGESLAEFWYDITLIAEQPLLKTLPMMQCILGQSCTHTVTVHNPSKKPITYKVDCSNGMNFHVGCVDNEVFVLPASSVDLTITFYPSAIGSGNHQAEINFINDLVGCLTFIVSGIGDAPVVSNDHVIQVEIGGNASTIIVFHNPFDSPIIVDVDLKQRFTDGQLSDDKESEFNLLLKVSKNLVLPPKAVIDIPISYAPDTMVKHEAVCNVTTRTLAASNDNLLDCYQGDVSWIYNIQGIPIRMPVKDINVPVLQCRARERNEETLEISIHGVKTGRVCELTSSDSHLAIQVLGQYIPASPDLANEFMINTDEYKYQLQYEDPEAEEVVSRAVGLTLQRNIEHKVTGVVTLLFHLVLAPAKSFNHLVHLVITSPSGGVWKYPIRFKAERPVADDQIVIESIGLNKESLVSFRISSQCSEPSKFEAFFASGYDPMFTVSPSNGVLDPIDKGGTLMTVCYKPTYYGKVHQGKLLVQTHNFQWIYDIKGVTPEYQPPQGNAVTKNRFQGKISQHRKNNFVRDNLRVAHTGVSSPLKGATLVQKTCTY